MNMKEEVMESGLDKADVNEISGGVLPDYRKDLSDYGIVKINDANKSNSKYKPFVLISPIKSDNKHRIFQYDTLDEALAGYRSLLENDRYDGVSVTEANVDAALNEMKLDKNLESLQKKKVGSSIEMNFEFSR